MLPYTIVFPYIVVLGQSFLINFMRKTITILVMFSLAGCSVNSYNRKRPSKREIKKAMSYSDWRYAQPQIEMSILNR